MALSIIMCGLLIALIVTEQAEERIRQMKKRVTFEIEETDLRPETLRYAIITNTPGIVADSLRILDVPPVENRPSDGALFIYAHAEDSGRRSSGRVFVSPKGQLFYSSDSYVPPDAGRAMACAILAGADEAERLVRKDDGK